MTIEEQIKKHQAAIGDLMLEAQQKAAGERRELEYGANELSKGPGLAGQTCRAKYWNELTIEEKIERCREQIKGVGRLSEELYRLYDRIEQLEEKFLSHKHTGAEVMLPARQDRNRGGDAASTPARCDVDPDKVYF